MYKKFEKDDLIYNVLIANPKVKFTIFSGSINNNFVNSANVASGKLALNDIINTGSI